MVCKLALIGMLQGFTSWVLVAGLFVFWASCVCLVLVVICLVGILGDLLSCV